MLLAGKGDEAFALPRCRALDRPATPADIAEAAAFSPAPPATSSAGKPFEPRAA